MRLIDQNGDNRGVMSTRDALDLAEEADLDLVEVAPNADPPVARIVEYSKFVYEKIQREKEARKKSKQVEIKTIKLKLKTADFHKDIQLKRAREWLSEGKKVKAEIRFYGREITYPELGRQIMSDVSEQLSEISTIEQSPQMEGRKMIMMLAPTVEPKSSKSDDDADNNKAQKSSQKKKSKAKKAEAKVETETAVAETAETETADA